MKWKQPTAFTLAFGILAVVGWTLHWHLTVNNAISKPVASQQNGYMSTFQCSEVTVGTAETDIVAEYGLPRDDTYDNGSTDISLHYPLTEDNSRNCNINFTYSKYKVYEVSIDIANSNDAFGN